MRNYNGKDAERQKTKREDMQNLNPTFIECLFIGLDSMNLMRKHREVQVAFLITIRCERFRRN